MTRLIACFSTLKPSRTTKGVPGHHLQFSIAQELPDLPAFRRFSEYDAYSEGWAFYAEQLGKQAGFYQDPYSEYGRLRERDVALGAPGG